MKLLFCTDGSDWTQEAASPACLLASLTADAVDVLIVGSPGESAEAIQKTIAPPFEALREQGISIDFIWREGKLKTQAVKEAKARSYDMLAIGSRGRRGLRRLLLGSVAAYVIRHASISTLILKGQPCAFKRFLICSAVGPTSEKTIHFAGRLARSMGASVTLIHVMSQIPLTDEAEMSHLTAEAQDLIENRSREGLHLSRMLDLLAEEGTKARAIVRHGLVIDEIIDEAQEEAFDLLVLGAHTTPGLRSRLIDDLAEQALLQANMPVLVVR